jgi:hypothetical protein
MHSFAPATQEDRINMPLVVVIDRDRIIRTGLMRLVADLGPPLAGVARDSLEEARRTPSDLRDAIVLVDGDTDDGATAHRELGGACRVLAVPVRRSASGVRRLAHGAKMTALVATLRAL